MSILADGKVIIDTEINQDGAKKGIGKLKTALNGLGKGAITAAKGVGVAVGVATTAVAGLVAKSVQAYSSYEQLVGGVETLFGA